VHSVVPAKARTRIPQASLGLILRSRAKRCVSKDEASSWFETRSCGTLLAIRRKEVARDDGN
jgi:hypothetical protein